MKVSDVIDAIEKNGYSKTKGAFYRDRAKEKVYPELGLGKEILYACAIGQAALNLGKAAPDLINALRFIDIPPILMNPNLGDAITSLNDRTEFDMAAIAAYLREHLSSEILDTELALA